jgi:ATP-dependent DNA helicase RecG
MPLRYLDKTNPQNIDSLEEGAWSVVAGTVFKNPEYNSRSNYVKIIVTDVRGARISATFFRQKWLQYQFKEGDEVILYGNYSVYTNGRGQKFPSLVNPKIDKIGTVRGDLDMIPIYPQKKSDKSWMLQKAQQELLERIVWIEDPVPTVLQKKFGLVSRNEAYKRVHFPTNPEDVEKARNRIAFDEFVRLQVFLEDRREKFTHQKGTAKTATAWGDQYINSLPFSFTDAQNNAVTDIRNDLSSERPMYRLLQGDVGTGKSELSAVAILTALEEGYQAVVLAPTDILAAQLAERMDKTFKAAGFEDIHIDLFNGKVLGKKRKELFGRLADGTTQLLIGTHAVIGKDVHFKNLGLVVVDEQHKFSTGQRTALLRSSQDSDAIPDFLMMTATPIPRTQSQILYGDMDMTIVENQIKSRKEIVTEWHQTPDYSWAKIREEVEAGHQAYVIAALVEESDSLENVEAAETTYQNLAMNVFPDLRVGLMHGKLDKKEKDAVIEAFYRNEIDILVSTSVVEVGVNVPNATVMTILNANRFGLSSLHQIRGRVGRGSLQSYCYLVGEATTFEAEERLKVMTETNNGFVIAEKDFEIRGEGSLFGKLQSGENDMFLANLKEHKELLGPTKRVAKQARKSRGLRKEVDLIYAGRTIEA